MLLFFALAMIAFFAALAVSAQMTLAPNWDEVKSRSMALNMAAYHHAVVLYARANPTLNNVEATDAQLTPYYPTGYAKTWLWRNTLSGSGRGVVYSSDPDIISQPGLKDALLTVSEYSMNVGTNASGFVWSPRAGNVSVPISPSVPTGSIVWVF